MKNYPKPKPTLRQVSFSLREFAPIGKVRSDDECQLCAQCGHDPACTWCGGSGRIVLQGSTNAD